MEIKLLRQEQSANAKFNGRVYMTKGFQARFGPKAMFIAVQAISKIIDERVNSKEGADYLQVVTYEGAKFWVMDDGTKNVTILLPEEY